MTKTPLKMFTAALFALMATTNLALLPQPTEKPRIFQTDRKIVVDGKLDDWTGIQEWPVNKAIDGTKIEPSADLSVMARFAFDAGYFYAAVEVKDDILNFPEQGGLFGDMLFLVFVEPSTQTETANFMTFGFTLRKNEPVKVLVNRGGEPFPQGFTKDIQLMIVPGTDKKSFVSEVAVPWTYIPFFRPFLQPEWGINLEYTDADAGKRKSVQLVADPNSERDVPKRSRGMVFEFVPRLPEAPEFQSLLNASHFYLESERKIRLAVQSPSAQKGWQLTTVLSSVQGTQISKQDLAFDKGMNVMDFPIEIEIPATGHYDISLGIIDDKGVLKFTEDKQFFLVEKTELDARAAKLNEIKKGEAFQKDEVFRESLPTLEIRLKWIQEFVADAPPFVPLDRLEQWNEEMNGLFRSVEDGKPALFPNGQVVQLAYRAGGDGPLKPYSVFIPEWYDPKTPLPLLVTLSGGPDGEQALGGLAAAYYGPVGKKRAGDLILLAPEPENPSGWYDGEASQEIMDCINHLKKLYKVNEKSIVLDGSGRGAYGALRLAFLNPDIFRGIMSRMGIFTPPADAGIENLLDLAARARSQNILIVQGQLDQPGVQGQISSMGEAGRPEDARDFAAKLKELGMNVRLIEAKAGGDRSGRGRPEAGPGGRGGFGASNSWADIAGWLKDLLGDSAVFTKPPKRQPDKEREKK
ncbi:MAG: sugar-binding protein [Clostridiales bacterium]|nr:sugar-binding protein [Clostridiales bacterium]